MNKIKDSIKVVLKHKFLPSYKLNKLTKVENKRYLSSYSKPYHSNEQAVKSTLLLHSHRLEKGLSHINFRKGFGQNACELLKKAMDNYNKAGFSKDKNEYKLALSVLNAYIEKHKSTELPKFFKKIFKKYLFEIKNSSSDIGGTLLLNKESKLNNRNVNYKTLCENRVSIREWSDAPINMDLVLEAIDISMKSPSVCNRQSSRIRIINRPEIVNKAINLQGGFSGYKIPPSLALITTDTRDFVNVEERSQVYIDGGLFAMNFLNGIEYVGLGACALSAVFTSKKDKEMRKLLNVPSNENFIMFIAIGNLLNETPYCKSWRKPVTDITLIIN